MARHYRSVAATLDIETPIEEVGDSEFLFLVPDLGPATRDGIAYLRAIRPEHITALHVGSESDLELAAAEWALIAPRLGALRPLPGADEHLVKSLRAYIRARSAPSTASSP